MPKLKVSLKEARAMLEEMKHPKAPDGLKGSRVYCRDGKHMGIATGSVRRCQLAGCGGVRVMVRWPGGSVTWPCMKGMKPGPHGRSFRIL